MVTGRDSFSSLEYKDETLTLGNMKDENGKLVEKTISLTTKLKALVFIPDLYEDGVEATKYKYANGDFIEAEKEGNKR